jgi:hypothetical protein
MTITEELLWEFAANRLTPEETEWVNAAIRKDKALMDEVNAIWLLQELISANLAETSLRAPENSTLSILKKVTELQAKQEQQAGNLLLYVLFIPLLLFAASFYLFFFKKNAMEAFVIDPVVPALIVMVITLVLLSSIGARYMLYKLNSHKA